MNSERQIVQRLLESSVTINGHKYECYFGRYYKDGKPISRDEYLEDTCQSTAYNGATYEPSEDGEHQVVTRNGKTYHLDYGETLDDEDEYEEPKKEPIKSEQYCLVRRFGNSTTQYLHKDGRFYTDYKNLRVFSDRTKAESARRAIERNSREHYNMSYEIIPYR